jgi:hypothetical protein
LLYRAAVEGRRRALGAETEASCMMCHASGLHHNSPSFDSPLRAFGSQIHSSAFKPRVTNPRLVAYLDLGMPFESSDLLAFPLVRASNVRGCFVIIIYLLFMLFWYLGGGGHIYKKIHLHLKHLHKGILKIS